MSKLVKYLGREATRLASIPKQPMKLMTHNKLIDYEMAMICHMCGYVFASPRLGEIPNLKVRDHCHYTRGYRGPAHRLCNPAYQVPPYIPVMAHNMSGHDLHLIIKALASRFPDGNMTVITENNKKYISASINGVSLKLRFLDSLGFMQSSLDSLVRNLVGVNELRCDCGSDAELEYIDSSYVAHGRCKSNAQCLVCHSYRVIRSCCKSCSSKTDSYNCQHQLFKKSIHNNFSSLLNGHTDEQFRLLLRKGVYQYE